MLKKHPLITFIFFGFILFLISNRLDELRVYQGATVAIYAIGIASLILLIGYSGQVSLGHGAFLAIGGFAAALVRIHFEAPIWLTFVVAVLAAALGGALLGLRKLDELAELLLNRQRGYHGKDEPLTAEQELAATRRRSTR